MLNPEKFQKAIEHLKFNPDLDCFASRLNTELPKYISDKPDPYAYLIDAFCVHWVFCKCYLFPPFSLIGQTLQKIRRGYSCNSKVANPVLVQHFSGNVVPGTICGDPTQREINSTTKNIGTAPLVVEASTPDRKSLREVFLSQGFDNDTVDI